MTGFVTLGDIEAAAARLAGVVTATPLLPHPWTRPPLLIKPESLQPVGSFKLRGAYNAISALPARARERGVVATPAETTRRRWRTRRRGSASPLSWWCRTTRRR